MPGPISTKFEDYQGFNPHLFHRQSLECRETAIIINPPAPRAAPRPIPIFVPGFGELDTESGTEDGRDMGMVRGWPDDEGYVDVVATG